ncbi:MAG: hypothetical protein QM498_05505 [Desulfobacterium sp.]
MNEFLKNLRNPQRGQKPKYTATTRKTAEGNFNTSVDRRGYKERRESQATSFDDLPPGNDTLNQILPSIKIHLTAITTAVERMCETGEKLAETQAEFQQAMTCFFNNVNDILTEKIVPQAVSSTVEQKNTDAPMPEPMEGERFTKTEVIHIIREMREKRCTFGEIAAELKVRAIPTFSGRGEWHAQTIHRLCRK